MSHYLRFSCFSLIILTCFLSCEKKSTNKVRISVKLDSSKNARIDVVTHNLLNMDTLLLATSTLDSNGTGTIELDIASPVFAVVESSNQFIPVYISPGDKLVITPDSNKTKKSIHYAGDGASVNKFLRSTLDAQQQCELSNNKYIIDINEDAEFFTRMDSLRKTLKNLAASLESDKTVDQQTLTVMKIRNKMIEYYFIQKFTQARYGFYLDDPAIPAALLGPIKKLPQDSLALATNMYEYGIILSSYLQTGIYPKVEEQTKDLDPRSVEGKFPEIADSLIQKQSFSKPLKDHFRAANINFLVRMEGLSPELQKLVNGFYKEINAPTYVATLKKSFAMWESIGPGKPAPDFTGQTADGKKLSLSSLKGKVVYVDVWATWCGPCKEEFPHSKKLMKAFEGNDKVVFLFVSTDQNMETWKKMLPDKSIPKGIHINQAQDKQADAIWENYHLWGIPRYILIDAEGKMLQTHAPSPSSGKVEALLNKMIKI